MREIIVRARSNDIHVCFAGDSKTWEAGKSINDALEKFLRTLAEELGIKITISDDPHTQRYLENPDIIKH